MRYKHCRLVLFILTKELKMLKAKVVLLLLLSLVLVLVSTAQDEETEALPGTDATYLWSAGVLNVDNTVFYSVTVGVGADDLSDVTIRATLPEGAAFVAESWMPEGAAFSGVSDGVATWTIDALTKETFVGPFTMQVEFENSDAEDFAAPAEVAATLTSSTGTVANVVTANTIVPFAETGTIEITPEGTGDELVPVGETGIWMLVPADAVSEPVTLTFNRVTLLGEDAGPEIEGVDEETWWCAQVSITADADVTFTQPILLVIPTRRAITPLTLIPVFTQAADAEWVLASDPETAAEALVGYKGNSTYVVLNAAAFGTASQQIAIGTTLRSGTATATSLPTKSVVPVVVNHEEQ
jgi:hypothetical protein